MKIDLSKSKKLEKEFQEIINKEYEEIGRKLIYKFFKSQFINQWKEEQINYLYIHSIKGRSLSGIEFNIRSLSISRVGYGLDWFENWEEMDNNEIKKFKKEIIKFFHLDDIFKGVNFNV